MTWESIVLGALQGISTFANTLISIVSGALNPLAIEGLTFLFLLGVVLRIINGGSRIPEKIAERVRKRDDEDEEWVLVRRRR